MNLTKNQMEQLVAIARKYPVFAGDLICKQTTKELVDLKLVKYKPGHDISCTSDGERIGGYVPTNKGLATIAVYAMSIPDAPKEDKNE